MSRTLPKGGPSSFRTREPAKDYEDIPEDDLDGDLNLVDGELQDFDEDEHEFSYIGSGGTAAEAKFDEIVGALEEIIMDPEFNSLQNKFLCDNCIHFEPGEENKLIYMDIFRAYVDRVEKYIERRLRQAVANFSMEEFMNMLRSRGEDEIAGDVFEILLSLGDFETFKDLMLSYKQSLSAHVQLSPDVRKVTIHIDEDEEGLEMPDLNLCIPFPGTSVHI